MRTHQELDDRSLALHRLIADKIRHDPALFDKARATLDHWRQRVSIRAQPCLDEWAQLMDQGMDACLAVAVENSEHATAAPVVAVFRPAEQPGPFCFLEGLAQRHRPCCALSWST